MSNETDVFFESGNISLEGTLMLPDGHKKPPVVLLLPGSGPVDRNENVEQGLMKFLSNNLKVFAECFADMGIASFRYDKRGVNKTKYLSKKTGFTNILEDASAAIAFLSNHEKVDGKQIFILGHSEGGVIGTIIAAENQDIKGFIGVASPITALDQAVLNQFHFIFQQRFKSSEKAQKFIDAFTQVFEEMRKKRSWDQVDAKTVKHIFSSVSFAFKILPARTTKKTIAKQLRPQWFIESYDYNFEQYAQKIRCPVLLIFGKKDYQVPVEEGRKFKKILIDSGNAKVTLVELDDLNHMLRHNAGEMSPKASIKSVKNPMDPRILDSIKKWFNSKK